jgi:hypothetical protein
VFEWFGVLDFFNNREKAILLWTVGLGVFAAIKSDGLGGSLLRVLGALASPKLLLLFGSAALYCATLLFLANAPEFWHSTALKATVYWFLGTGVVLVGRATQAPPVRQLGMPSRAPRRGRCSLPSEATSAR